ncbi:thiol:disulfide interchange protein DsbC [Pseudomonas solani]|uniref:Thiol:disulfide interchange protein n=1 Tax=Pseudomonas solani TaxID=2731552 RepID=A0ABN6BK84_9PSED|nr:MULTISPECIES: thioredoxin fold domain-containing protein [Pseudomonas]EQM71686.1 protein-disulfide isomerase [Pseudomonas alcaligenes OT 69]MDN4148287.1 thioredoxin fold domain-containing protein [Pseudomonas tohonis]MDU9412450.1 thioredoxin fold domain-containing protein [Pseudomonas sp. zfem005]WCD79338.1 thioredoxin fold domain-containing protein [Pseudomonas sp. TUM22785]BCD84464.1 thiol:disulfide interchange protein DsbC [Pseudomonas solani]
MRVTRLFAAMALGLVSTFSLADDPDQAIRKTLSGLELGLPIESIGESPMSGIYQVQLKGGRMLYTSADGQYLMQGYLYHVKDGKPVNLTEQSESRSIAKEINAIPESEMVVFAPKEPAKAHITVFTDTDCGYCQKLHSEVPELNRRGIEVRYVAFPRQGLGSHGYNSLVSVWCSKDRQAAMNKAKSREELPSATCDNPVAKQFELGQLIGVNGTPAIVLGNGQMIPGYQPAPQLAKIALEAK